jgi:hypothetical protein
MCPPRQSDVKDDEQRADRTSDERETERVKQIFVFVHVTSRSISVVFDVVTRIRLQRGFGRGKRLAATAQTGNVAHEMPAVTVSANTANFVFLTFKIHVNRKRIVLCVHVTSRCSTEHTLNPVDGLVN